MPLDGTSTQEIPAVVSGLRKAFDSGTTRSLAWRREQLERFRTMLIDREAELAAALHKDLGKPRLEAFIGEIKFVQIEVEHALKNLRRWTRNESVSTPLSLQPAKSMIVREPLGVVLIIGPWNYPVQLVLGALVPAIAAGNCACLKPSELAPASSAAMARLVAQYLDTSCIQVVEGGVAETQALLGQKFDHILFTGGGTVGKIVMEAAAKNLTPVTLELGGKSPCIVDRDADLDVAARRITWGKFFNTGQTCIAPDYLLVQKDVVAPLLEKITAAIAKFYGDEPKKSPDYGRIINERHHARLVALLKDGTVVTGGAHDVSERYIAPTVLEDVKLDSKLMADEIFGPILPVLTVKDVDEAIAFVNARPKPLALYIFAKDRAVQDTVLARTSSGGACVNDVIVHPAVPDLPFGGVGPSGMGAYHGRAGFETFTHRKGVVRKSTALDPALRYPPYDANKEKWVRRLT
jgi:aldehyde dehydrogenase (NAD+)